MDASKFEPTQETKLHFLDYWRIIRIRKAIIITVFLTTAIFATAITFILPQYYAGTTRIKIDADTGDIPGLTDTTSYSPYDPYFIQTEFEIIQDQVVLGKVIQTLNLNDKWGKLYNGGEPFTTAETMKMLGNRMSLNTVRNTKLIEITVFSEDRDEAALIANTIAAAYKDYRQDLRKQLSTGGIKAMEDEYQDHETQIQTFQTNVDQLRKDLNINDTDPFATGPSPTMSPDELRQLDDQRIEDEANYDKLKEQLTGLQKLDTEQLRDALPTYIQDSTLNELLNDLNAAQQQLAKLKSDASAQHPDVMRIQSLVDELNREADARVNGIMLGMQNNVNSQKAALDSLVAALQEAKQKDQEDAIRSQPYWEAKRTLENMQDFDKILSAKIESEKLDLEIPKTAMVEITRQAEPEKDPVRPKKTLNIVLGAIFGLILGVSLAFFIEYLDTSVKTIDEVERALQAPVLGVIPQNAGLLIDEEIESPHAEAYRVLRTHILFSGKDAKFNTVAIVSAGAGEGKSTTTLNLATVFAQAGQRVLVVDSDLRRPTLHKLLRVSNNIGLVSYLLKQNTLEQVIQTTRLPTLDFLASGKLPSSSMSILNSPQMRNLITELKQRYDFIFFDSPPILGMSDAAILASEVDLTIQVIQFRRYPQPMNVRAKQMVEKVGGHLVGIVLNNINMSQDESYYYYSGYYQDSGYAKDADEPEAAGKTLDDNQTEIKQKY
jgi:capsular exopolysaccharide synthesis family protein